MNLRNEKIELAKMLLNTESEAVIKQVKAVFEKQEKDFWDELSDVQKLSIETSLKQADEGRVVSHKTAMKKYRKWL
ncbi:MAG TPA: hypothetical protein VI757_12845 [Bacteroidia bacterium]|nr:hypothetical protein [Bacteroidia bacterium]